MLSFGCVKFKNYQNKTLWLNKFKKVNYNLRILAKITKV